MANQFNRTTRPAKRQKTRTESQIGKQMAGLPSPKFKYFDVIYLYIIFKP